MPSLDCVFPWHVSVLEYLNYNLVSVPLVFSCNFFFVSMSIRKRNLFARGLKRVGYNIYWCMYRAK